MWPLQWRVALTSLSGFLIFYIANPLIFAFLGAVAAGQYGMTMSVWNGVQSVALVWVTTKSPRFGSFVASGDLARLDRVFFGARRRAVGIALLGAAAVLGGDLLLARLGYRVTSRLLPFPLLAALAIPLLINVVTFSQSLYLRAHREDPFMLPSVIGGVLTGIALFLAARFGGVSAVVIAYSLSFVPGLLILTAIFRHKRRAYRNAADFADVG